MVNMIPLMPERAADDFPTRPEFSGQAADILKAGKGRKYAVNFGCHLVKSFHRVGSQVVTRQFGQSQAGKIPLFRIRHMFDDPCDVPAFTGTLLFENFG